MLFILRFQNPTVHLIFFLVIRLHSDVHFSLHHNVELELGREDLELNYKVPRKVSGRADTS